MYRNKGYSILIPEAALEQGIIFAPFQLNVPFSALALDQYLALLSSAPQNLQLRLREIKKACDFVEEAGWGRRTDGFLFLHPLFSLALRRRARKLKEYGKLAEAFTVYYQLHSEQTLQLLESAQGADTPFPAQRPGEYLNLLFALDLLCSSGKKIEAPFLAADRLLAAESKTAERQMLVQRLLILLERAQEDVSFEKIAVKERLALLLRDQGRLEESAALFNQIIAEAAGLSSQDPVFKEVQKEGEFQLVTRANLLSNYASVLRLMKDYAACRKALEEALELVVQTSARQLLCDIYHDMALLEKALYDYGGSRHFFAKALCLARSSPQRSALLFFNLGALEEDHHRYQKSLGYYRQAMARFKATGDRQRLAQSWQNIGLVHDNLGEYQESIYAYKKAVVLFIGIYDAYGEAQIYQNLALAELNLGNDEDCIFYLNRALVVYQAIGANPLQAEVFQNLGEIHRRFGRSEESLSFGRKALELFQSLGDMVNVGKVHQNLGNTFLHYQVALSIFQEQRLFFEQGLIYQNLAELARRKGDYATASECLKQALRLFLPFKEAIRQIGWLVANANQLASEFNDKTVLESLDGMLQKAFNQPEMDSIVKAAREFQERFS